MDINCFRRFMAATWIIFASWGAGYAQEPARPSPQLPEEGVQKAQAGRITVDELKTKLEKGEPVVIIDSRSPMSYASSNKQIKGAIRVPPSDIGPHVKDIPKDKELIVYCA